MDTKDYIKIFEQSSELFLVIDTNFAIVAASDAYLKATTTVRENIVGLNIFEAFPDNPDDKTANGESIVRASINRVIKNKTQDVLPVVKYDIPKPESEGGGFELKYWKPCHSPVFDESGNVKYIIQRVEDVTENETLITQLESEKKALKLLEDSDKRYTMMLMNSQFAFAVLKGKNMVITLANDSVKEMWGKGKDLEGKPLLEVLPEIKDSAYPGLLDKVYATGIPFYGEELLAPVFRNGKLEDVYFNFVYQPYLEADETISGVTIIAYEVTASVTVKKALKAQHESEQKALKLAEDSEKQMQKLFNLSPFSLTFMEGKNFVYKYVNQKAAEILGAPVNEVIGKSLFEILPEIKAQVFKEKLTEVLETGKPFVGKEVPATYKRGDNLVHAYFDFVYEPFHDSTGKTMGVVSSAIDVTEKVLARKKIEESEKHFRQMADLVPAKISNADPAGNVLYFNKLWLDYTGFSFEELRDFGYYKIMHPDELDEFQKRLQKAGETGTALEMEMRFMNKDGDYRWHLNLASPIKDENGNIKMWVGSTTDIHEQKTVAEKIKASEQRFRLLVMQAPVAICVVRGAKYVVETVNSGMLEFWGRTEAQVLNKPIFEVLTELEDQGFEALVDGVYTTGERFVATELPITLLRKGQLENAYVTFIYEPLREVDGTISGIMVVAHEVTDQVNARKAIEISEKKFRTLTNTMPQKISSADADGNVIFFNQQWLDDTGLTFDELKDWGWEKSIHTDDLMFTVANWKHSIATGDIFDMECRILNKKGEYRWHLSRALPIKDEAGKIIMWIGSNTDIHEQKEEKEVLEKAVKRRTKQLKQKNLELEHANKDLIAFTYISSHDLQEPLRKIQDFVAVILTEEEQNLSEDGKGYFVRLQETAKRMQRLIEDLLAYSRASNSQKIFEKIDLNIILDEVKKDFGEDIQQKKGTIEAAGLCEMNMIRFQFRQLLHNLIGNSLKFSKENTAPHITILCKIEKGSTLNNKKLSPKINYYHIIFTDNGIGFDPQYKERIFEVFQRLHTIEEYRGTGIGLAICKRIVENHNGIITATGELNKGARFDIYIPA